MFKSRKNVNKNVKSKENLTLLFVKVCDPQCLEVRLERAGVVVAALRIHSDSPKGEMGPFGTRSELVLVKSVQEGQGVLAARETHKDLVSVSDHLELGQRLLVGWSTNSAGY